MRALEIFLQAGLLGRGIFIPPGFDPDTFVRERGATAFAELTDKSELLVDYFIRDQAEKVGGPTAPLEKRAEAAALVAEKLRLISDEIQFNLIVRKAQGLLGIREEVLRDEALALRRRPNRPKPEIEARKSLATGVNDAAEKAGVGLIAIALVHPELRSEIFAAQPFVYFSDSAVAKLLEEICESHQSLTDLSDYVLDQLREDQKSALTALLVGEEKDIERPQSDSVIPFAGREGFDHYEQVYQRTKSLEQSGDRIAEPQYARRVLRDFVRALEERHKNEQTESLNRIMKGFGNVPAGDEFQAQKIVELNRRSKTESGQRDMS